jgi:thiamine biosynthesis lipoprotein ApbE
MRDVELLSDNQVICHAPVMMDLGGIAKGFAVDCAVKVLIESGCNGGLVNAGGDVRVFGKPQSMFIQYSTNLTTSKSVHPEPPIILSLSKDEGLMQTSARVSQVELCDQALAVSQYNHVDRPVEHQGYYRRNSDKFPLHEHVVVIAQSAAVADALTKCVMWCDGDASNALCKEFKARVLFADKESW